VTSAGRFVEYVWPMMTASQRCSSRMMNLIKQMRQFFKLLLDIEVLSSPSIESFWAINAAVKRVRRRLLLVRIGTMVSGCRPRRVMSGTRRIRGPTSAIGPCRTCRAWLSTASEWGTDGVAARSRRPLVTSTQSRKLRPKVQPEFDQEHGRPSALERGGLRSA
jgi:hypothetical protein